MPVGANAGACHATSGRSTTPSPYRFVTLRRLDRFRGLILDGFTGLRPSPLAFTIKVT